VVACLATCSAKLSAAFAKADQKGGCQTTGNARNVDAYLEALLANLEENTYSEVQWGKQPSVATNLLLANYDTIYASTFDLVDVGLTSGSSMVFTDTDSVLAYLPAMGPPGPLNGNVLDPITTAAGTFGGDVLALRVNVDLHLVNGACVCPSSTIDCNGVCINPTSDAANCGSCGHPCASHVCSAGVCQ